MQLYQEVVSFALHCPSCGPYGISHDDYGGHKITFSFHMAHSKIVNIIAYQIIN